MKKIALLICTILMLSLCLASVPALANGAIAVSVRVEGISSTVATSDAGYTTAVTNALDAVTELLTAKNIPHTVNNGMFGKEVISIDGQTKGQFGGYDGWLYTVNGVMPMYSIDTCPIADGDQIVVYYGDFPPGTLIPQITMPNEVAVGQKFTVELKSTYDEYLPPNYLPSPKTVAIVGATISINGTDYITNNEGKAAIIAPSTVGSYDVAFGRQVNGSLPTMVRCTKKLTVKYQVSVRVEGINSNITSSDAGYATTATNVLDALTELLTAKSIPHTVNNGLYGKEVISIDNQTKGQFGGYDGWLYTVNGVMPMYSIDTCPISNNDQIVVYYGDFPPGTLIPQIAIPSEVIAGQQFTVELKSTYDEYLPPDYMPSSKTVAIENAIVSINGVDYTTGSDGKATVTAPDVSGVYAVEISKQSQGSVPAMVRQTVYLTVKKNIEVGTFVFSVNNAPVSSLISGTLDSRVIVTNHSSQTVAPILALKVYDGNRLVGVTFSAGDQIASGNAGTLSASISVPSASYTVKAFVLKDIANIQPLCDAPTVDSNGIH